ncbi:MAG: cytochrome c3 family protein [Chloroflexi bacterium]|nr:cytochrome c3 family protein [Chloroflexota bacterium]
MRRLALVLAGGALWLILAAVPALADGGPHVMAENNGSLGINADGCAGCHRAHTAQGPFLINAADETALCKTCHGAVAVGSSVDVMTGVQYTLRGVAGVGGTQLGALRNGGFDQARIDSGNAARLSYDRTNGANVDISQRPKVGVGAATDVTSSHLAMSENGLTMPGVAWGNGANGSGAGPVVELSCASCHNPHGNGQYRILNPIPEATDADAIGTAFGDGWVIPVVGSVAADDPDTTGATQVENDRILTETSHALLIGDTVAITGTPFDGTYVVASTGTDSDVFDTVDPTILLYDGSGAPYFRVYASGSSGALLDITADSTTLTGMVERTSGARVTDSPVDNPDATESDTKNYTVIQVKGTQGTDSTYLLYADDVVDAGYGPTTGDYFHRNVPWMTALDLSDPDGGGGSVANDAPNGRPSTTVVGGVQQISFSEQITAWCSACHTRYFADRNPTDDATDGINTGSAWGAARPGDDLYKYEHRTVPNRACVTCHVSHGSNAVMDGTFSSTMPYPNGDVPGVTAGIDNGNSRLLKIDNRGTCQACHDPTETTTVGTYYGPLPMPTVP